jgi:negative regulator of flagellin synthesis FlgM
MSNRIDPGHTGTLGKLSGKTGKPGVRAADGPSAQATQGAGGDTGATDRVELTGHGKLIAQAESMLAAVPAIDQARVAEVRQAIENGEYVIDADSITDALLRSDLELNR